MFSRRPNRPAPPANLTSSRRSSVARPPPVREETISCRDCKERRRTGRGVQNRASASRAINVRMAQAVAQVVGVVEVPVEAEVPVAAGVAEVVRDYCITERD